MPQTSNLRESGHSVFKNLSDKAAKMMVSILSRLWNTWVAAFDNHQLLVPSLHKNEHQHDAITKELKLLF